MSTFLINLISLVAMMFFLAGIAIFYIVFIPLFIAQAVLLLTRKGKR